MPIGKPTDPVLKAEILNQIKNNGMSVSEAAKKYDVRTNLIYKWMSLESSTSNKSLLVELNRTKRELENAYALIGKLTAEKNISNLKK